MNDCHSDLSVLIADDQTLFRAGLRAVIGAAPGLELAGEAARRLATYFADAPGPPARDAGLGRDEELRRLAA